MDASPMRFVRSCARCCRASATCSICAPATNPMPSWRNSISTMRWRSSSPSTSVRMRHSSPGAVSTAQQISCGAITGSVASSSVRRSPARHRSGSMPWRSTRYPASYDRRCWQCKRKHINTARFRRLIARSAVEHRPADIVPQPLIVEDERANRLRELVALPLALASPCPLGLSLRRSGAGGLDRIARTQIVGLGQLEKVKNMLRAGCRPEGKEMVVRIGESSTPADGDKTRVADFREDNTQHPFYSHLFQQQYTAAVTFPGYAAF